MGALQGTRKRFKKPAKAWLESHVEAMAAKFHQDLSSFSVKAYIASWGDLGEEYSEERLDSALQRCLAECAFFPTVDEIKARVPAESYQPLRCVLCRDNDGWVFAVDRRVRRCQHEAQTRLLPA